MSVVSIASASPSEWSSAVPRWRSLVLAFPSSFHLSRVWPRPRLPTIHMSLSRASRRRAPLRPKKWRRSHLFSSLSLPLNKSERSRKGKKKRKKRRRRRRRRRRGKKTSFERFLFPDPTCAVPDALLKTARSSVCGAVLSFFFTWKDNRDFSQFSTLYRYKIWRKKEGQTR